MSNQLLKSRAKSLRKMVRDILKQEGYASMYFARKVGFASVYSGDEDVSHAPIGIGAGYGFEIHERKGFFYNYLVGDATIVCMGPASEKLICYTSSTSFPKQLDLKVKSALSDRGYSIKELAN